MMFFFLLAGCSQVAKPTPVWNVHYHVVGYRVAIDSVDSNYPQNSPEFKMALYWYLQAFDQSLQSSGPHRPHDLKFKSDSVGTAAAAGNEAGYRDAEIFKASRQTQGARPAG